MSLQSVPCCTPYMPCASIWTRQHSSDPQTNHLLCMLDPGAPFFKQRLMGYCDLPCYEAMRLWVSSLFRATPGGVSAAATWASLYTCYPGVSHLISLKFGKRALVVWFYVLWTRINTRNLEGSRKRPFHIQYLIHILHWHVWGFFSTSLRLCM